MVEASPTPWSKEPIGPYRVEGEIAAGGQGVVLLAHHQGLDKQVALKLLLTTDRRSVRRFQQEGQVLARLAHPNLLKVSDLGEVDGRPFLAMELVEGRDLRAVVAEDGLPDPAWIARVLRGVAQAVQYCHEQGLVHRDLKPGNVLIEAETERPVLVDFGLVKRDPEKLELDAIDEASTQLSLTGETKGTPSFMAPEQVDPELFGEVGPRTDVYGLGATLFFLLTGTSPFRGATPYAVIVKVMGEDPPDPLELNPDVPYGLARLCLQALDKEQERRPRSAREFADRLRRALDESAPPQPIEQDARETPGRPGGPGVVVASFVATVLILGGIFLALFTAREDTPSPPSLSDAALQPSPAKNTQPEPAPPEPADDPRVVGFRRELWAALREGAGSIQLNRLVARVESGQLAPKLMRLEEVAGFRRKARVLFRARDKLLSERAQVPAKAGETLVVLGVPPGARTRSQDTAPAPDREAEPDVALGTLTSRAQRARIEGRDPTNRKHRAVLLEVLRFRDWHSRLAAITALSRVSDARLVGELQGETDTLVQEGLLLAFARSKAEGTLPWTLKRLSSKKWVLRRAAAAALGQRGDRSVVPRLDAALGVETSVRVRRHLRAAVAALSAKAPRSKRRTARVEARGVRFTVRSSPRPAGAWLPVVAVATYGWELAYLEQHLRSLEDFHQIHYVTLPAVEDFLDPPLHKPEGLPLPRYPLQRVVEAFGQLMMRLQARGELGTKYAILADRSAGVVAAGHAARSRRAVRRLILVTPSQSSGAQATGLGEVVAHGRRRNDLEMQRYGLSRQYVRGAFLHVPRSDAERWALARKALAVRFGEARDLAIAELYGPLAGVAKQARGGVHWVPRYRRPVSGCFAPPFSLKSVAGVTPTLLLSGKHAREATYAEAMQVARWYGVKTARAVLFKKSGSLPCVEEQPRFDRLLRMWLGSPRRRRR